IRTQFVSMFPATNKPTDAPTSILQALLLMNSPSATSMANPGDGPVLTAILDAPFMDNPQKLETLFLTTLSRFPTATEKAKFGSYLEKGGPSGNTRKAAGDILWVLLNCTEFLTNH
ncbi:MAG: hypothetical protein ACRCZF_01490, partial [Gemmataceae bacterium]